MNNQTPEPREAAIAESSYRKPSRKGPALVIVGALALIAAIVIAINLLPSTPPGPSASNAPTSTAAPSSGPDESPSEAHPETVLDIPGYATVLEVSLRDGETASDIIDGYSVTATAYDQGHGRWSLGVEVIDTSKGEYVSDLDLEMFEQDAEAPKTLVEGDPGAWTVTMFPSESADTDPKGVAVISINDDTRVAVGLGWGPIHDWWVD